MGKNPSHEAVKKESLQAIATGAKQGVEPGVGHNGGPEYIREQTAQIVKLEDQKKDILKAIRECKANLKEKAGLNITAYSQVLREMKMQSDVRKNFVEDTQNIRDVLSSQMDMFHAGDNDAPADKKAAKAEKSTIAKNVDKAAKGVAKPSKKAATA